MTKSNIFCALPVALLVGSCATNTSTLPRRAIPEEREDKKTRPGVSQEDVRVRFLDLVADELGIRADEIDEFATWCELGADSLDSVTIVLATEIGFDLAVPDEDAARLQTPGQMIDYLCVRLHCR